MLALADSWPCCRVLFWSFLQVFSDWDCARMAAQFGMLFTNPSEKISTS